MSVCLLSGIKVLDFSRILAAPYASQLLADHGCTVYKIERTGYFYVFNLNNQIDILGFGDEVRRWQPPQINGQSCYFMTVNRNKKSLALNLGLKEGQNIARKLALKSDVIIENFKTGQMRKFGLDYETLSKQKSDLIYCSITGKLIL
jgi:crotonobetainyl-CoA:carnitine CoA-transferase CaiB-like acyl-CoA transferase